MDGGKACSSKYKTGSREIQIMQNIDLFTSEQPQKKQGHSTHATVNAPYGQGPKF